MMMTKEMKMIFGDEIKFGPRFRFPVLQFTVKFGVKKINILLDIIQIKFLVIQNLFRLGKCLEGMRPTSTASQWTPRLQIVAAQREKIGFWWKTWK